MRGLVPALIGGAIGAGAGLALAKVVETPLGMERSEASIATLSTGALVALLGIPVMHASLPAGIGMVGAGVGLAVAGVAALSIPKS